MLAVHEIILLEQLLSNEEILLLTELVYASKFYFLRNRINIYFFPDGTTHIISNFSVKLQIDLVSPKAQSTKSMRRSRGQNYFAGSCLFVASDQED